MNFINSNYAAQAITNLAKSLGTNVSDAANRANQQGYKINGKYLLQDQEFVSWVRQSFVPEQTQYNQTGNQ